MKVYNSIELLKLSRMQKNTPLLFTNTLFKSLHKRIVHNKILHKMGISETPTCLYCNNVETIEHVYIECENVRRFMEQYRKLGANNM